MDQDELKWAINIWSQKTEWSYKISSREKGLLKGPMPSDVLGQLEHQGCCPAGVLVLLQLGMPSLQGFLWTFHQFHSMTHGIMWPTIGEVRVILLSLGSCCLSALPTTKTILSKTFLVVQWLRLHTSNAGDVDSIPGWGTKIPHATHHGKKKQQHTFLADFRLSSKSLPRNYLQLLYDWHCSGDQDMNKTIPTLKHFIIC